MILILAMFLGYTQAALTPDAAHSLVVDYTTQYAQNLGNPPIAIPAMFAFIGLLAYGLAKHKVLSRHLRFITLCIAALAKGSACLSFTDSQLLDDLFNGLPAKSRVY